MPVTISAKADVFPLAFIFMNYLAGESYGNFNHRYFVHSCLF